MIQNKDLERIKNQRLENDGIHTENKAGGTVSEKQHELYTDHCVGVFFPYIDRGIIAPSPDCDERGGEYEFFKRVIYRNDIYLRDRTGGCGYGDTLDFVRSAGHTVFDTGRRTGLYDDGRGIRHVFEKEDLSFDPWSGAGEYECQPGRRHGKAGS